MAEPFVIEQMQADGTYIQLYPETSGGQVIGAVSDSTKLNGKVPDYYLFGYNELDNSNFFINQRGVSGKITAQGYFLDRWKLISGTVTLISAGIVLNGTITQILESAIGTSFTASSDAGTASYNDATRIFTLTATGQTITWAKLEKGTVKTPYVPKGYSEELAECQRFFQYYDRIRVSGAVMYVPTGDCKFETLLPQRMRISPTATVNGFSVALAMGNSALFTNETVTRCDIGTSVNSIFTGTVTINNLTADKSTFAIVTFELQGVSLSADL